MLGCGMVGKRILIRSAGGVLGRYLESMILRLLQMMMGDCMIMFKIGRKNFKRRQKVGLASKDTILVRSSPRLMSSKSFPVRLSVDKVDFLRDRYNPNYQRWKVAGGMLRTSMKQRIGWKKLYPYLTSTVIKEKLNPMSFIYIGFMILIPIVWLAWASSSMNKPSKRFLDLQTAEFEARGTPTRSLDISEVLDAGFAVRPTLASSPSPVVSSDGVVVDRSPVVASPVYIVVTATPTFTPTPTLNPYADLHPTLTALWHVFTVTPELATMWAKPLYDYRSGDCFSNCGFITITPTLSTVGGLPYRAFSDRGATVER